MRRGISRRMMLVSGAAAGVAPGVAEAATVSAPQSVEQWGVFEIELRAEKPVVVLGPYWPTPRQNVSVVFEQAQTRREIPGFFDGGDTQTVFRVRFMPETTGRWTWRINTDFPGWNGHRGAFQARLPSRGNHGPVRVADMYHFAYADGAPYRELGTTSYAWQHQPEARCAQTLRTLAASPFNKIRMAVFPTGSVHTEPLFPFERVNGVWTYEINPAFFQDLDRRVAQLCALGIEADIILFHPYDEARGFSAMSAAQDERYLRHVVARLSAYRNVWWSVANEWDLVKSKSEADFDRIFQIVRDADPYNHLRSIHQWRQLYDHNKPWVTHASIQNGAAVEDDARALLYRDAYRKPVVFDEVRYEGDIAARWGDLTPQQMTRAFWEAHVAGCSCGHGEAYQPDLWMGVGGTLRGESVARLAFLKRVMEEGPAEIDPIDRWWGRHIGGRAGQYYLRYFGEETPSEWPVDIPKDELSGGERFRADVIDTWAMTIAPVDGVFTLARNGDYSFNDPARPTIALPSHPWMAVRMTRL